VFDPVAKKNIVLLTADAAATLAYTGTAYISGLPTDEWLVERCIGGQIPRGPDGRPVTRLGGAHGALDFGRIVMRLKNALEEAFNGAAIAPSAKVMPFELAIAGWLWGRRKRGRPVLWSLLRNQTYPSTRVAVSPRYPGRVFLFRIAPPPNATHANVAAVRSDLRSCRSTEELEKLLVRAVRRTAAAVPGYVGLDVMSIHIPPPGARTVEVRYLPLREQTARLGGATVPIAYSPWIVAPRFLSPPQIVVGSQELGIGNWRVVIAAPQSRGPLVGGAFPQVRPVQP